MVRYARRLHYALVLFVAIGCSKQQQSPPPPAVDPPPVLQKSAGNSTPETLNNGEYVQGSVIGVHPVLQPNSIMVELKVGSNKQWLILPQMAVKPGDRLRYLKDQAVVLENFRGSTGFPPGVAPRSTVTFLAAAEIQAKTP